MSEFRLFSKCEGCKKRKLYISKRILNIRPMLEAKSIWLMCGDCLKRIKKALSESPKEVDKSEKEFIE